MTTRAAVASLIVTAALVAALVAGLDRLMAVTEREPGPEPAVERLSAPLGVNSDGACPSAPRAAREPTAVTAALLIECPRLMHDQPVTFRGEAVRAVLERGAFAWLHVNDDAYAIERGPLPEHRSPAGGNTGVPVRISRDLAHQVDAVGDARHRGTIVEVTGTWIVAGAGDGGALGIRADEFEVVAAGRPVTAPTEPLRTWVAGFMAVLAAAVTVWARLAKRKGSLPIGGERGRPEATHAATSEHPPSVG